MFEPFTDWPNKGRSLVERWVEVGDSKRILWMNGFLGKRTPLPMKKDRKWKTEF
jgi:hypothetical protein